jgi:hypothetical protein
MKTEDEKLLSRIHMVGEGIGQDEIGKLFDLV